MPRLAKASVALVAGDFGEGPRQLIQQRAFAHRWKACAQENHGCMPSASGQSEANASKSWFGDKVGEQLSVGAPTRPMRASPTLFTSKPSPRPPPPPPPPDAGSSSSRRSFASLALSMPRCPLVACHCAPKSLRRQSMWYTLEPTPASQHTADLVFLSLGHLRLNLSDPAAVQEACDYIHGLLTGLQALQAEVEAAGELQHVSTAWTPTAGGGLLLHDGRHGAYTLRLRKLVNTTANDSPQHFLLTQAPDLLSFAAAKHCMH